MATTRRISSKRFALSPETVARFMKKQKSVHPPAPDFVPVPFENGFHVYLSTACAHGYHAQCRTHCKFCPADCACACHKRKRIP